MVQTDSALWSIVEAGSLVHVRPFEFRSCWRYRYRDRFGSLAIAGIELGSVPAIFNDSDFHGR